MAEILYDISISVVPPGEGQPISEEEKSRLFSKPRTESAKPKQAGSAFRARSQLVDEPVEEILSLEDLSEGYAELIDRTEGLLTKLVARLGGLVYEFNPQEKPALADAVGSTFQGVNNKISYEMYLAALKLDKDLSVAIGESESEFIRQPN